MEQNSQQTDDEGKHTQSYNRWWERFCLRCHDADSTPSWQPTWWSKFCPFPLFSTYRQSAQQICIILFFLLIWGILYAELGESVGLHGELLSMTILVVAAYLIGWLWLRITTLPALIGMLLTGIFFQNVGLVHMTNDYRKLNQDLRKIALVIILTRAGLGLDATILKKHYAAVLQLGLLPWLVECIAIGISTHYLLHLPWIWGFLLGSMIASVSPAVVVPCLFRLRDVGYGVSKGIPTLVLAATAIDDSVSVAVFAIILNAMFSTGSVTFNIIKGPLSIVAGVVLGSLWGAMTSVIPEKGDIYVVPLRFLALFLGGLFALFISSLIGWSGAGPLAIVCAGFVAAFYWDKQGWAINKNPVSNLFRILWIFFEPILFAFTGAQITIDYLSMSSPRPKRATWSDESLRVAVIDVRCERLSTYKASAQYGVPRSTIRSHLKSGVLHKSLGRNAIFTKEQEKDFVSRIIKFSEIKIVLKIFPGPAAYRVPTTCRK